MRRLWKQFQWPFVGTLAVVVFVLGFVGFSKFSASVGEARSFWDILYLDLQLFVLESGSVWGPVPWELQIARLLAPLVAGYAAVGALVLLFRDRFEQMLVRFRRGHVIICGLGRKGLLLARSLKERGDAVVILEEDAENDLIETARGFGAVVMIGDARDPHLLKKAGFRRAAHLLAVGGDDGVNAEVAVHARRLAVDRKGPPLSCLVHIVDPDLCNLLRMQEIGSRNQGPFRLDFFNVFEGGARTLLSDFPVACLPSETGNRSDHIVIVGLGRFGESLVLQAARDWRSVAEERGGRLQVTVVDKAAGDRVEALLARYPWLEEACRLKPVDAPFESRTFAEARFLSESDENPAASAVFVCADDDSRALSAALALSRRAKGLRIPIVVRTVHGAGLASLLQQSQREAGGTEGLFAFGLLDRMCNPDLLFAGAYETLAQAMHEEYMRDQKPQGETAASNPSIAPWNEVSEDRKESSRAQAAHVGIKLAAVGCDLAPLTDWNAERFTFDDHELELLARMEHERWMTERKSAGWALGAKNPEKLTTPYLVPWSELDEEVRELDRLFIRGLPRFLAKAGFQIVRIGGKTTGQPS